MRRRPSKPCSHDDRYRCWRNLIKQNSVNPNLPINGKIVLKLTGINNLPLFTMGQIPINILGYPTILNIIPNEVSIDEDGVLGSEFFEKIKSI